MLACALAAMLRAMELTVNGARREVPAAITVTELLAELGLGNDLVAVERNEEIVPRAQHPQTTLEDGDAIEIVHFVGGG